MSFRERLEFILKSEKSTHAFAKKSGLQDSMLRKYLNDGSVPRIDSAVAIADAAGVTVQWLITGEDPPSTSSDNPKQLSNDGSHSLATDNGAHPLIYVPKINLRASAGDGQLITEEKTTALLAFHKEYLRNTWSIYTSRLFCMEVNGESMMPTISHGELLICSHDMDDKIPSDGVFIVRLEGHVMVKRLQFLPNRRLKVSSDNTLYEPFEIALDDGVDFEILGKVLLINGVRRV